METAGVTIAISAKGLFFFFVLDQTQGLQRQVLALTDEQVPSNGWQGR